MAADKHTIVAERFGPVRTRWVYGEYYARISAKLVMKNIHTHGYTLLAPTHGWRSAIVCAGIVLLAACAAQAQVDPDSYLNQQRQIERQLELTLREQLPPAQQFQIDYGGWYTPQFYMFDDGFEGERTLRRHNLRLWLSLNADQGLHTGYVRMQTDMVDWNTGHSYDGDDNQVIKPRLERGWYRMDVTGILDKYADIDLPVDMSYTIGRQLVEFGSGYALSLNLDAVLLQGSIGDLYIDGLLGKTPHSLDNLDRSRPQQDNSNRYFYGIQTRYRGWTNHELFAYYLWQKDHQGETPIDLLQEYRYDSQYLGFGSMGQLDPRVRYSWELVYQRGRSPGDGQWRGRNDIEALGWDFQIEYLHPGKYHPRAIFEYMFASGDPDRLFSPTDALGGNQRFTPDHSFVAFGYRDTGLSFAPTLSNIHIWRAGASFFPFEDINFLKRMELGTDWFLYAKNKSAAAVSDPLADQASGYLGWEMDYFSNWRISSDLAWTVRCGWFFPGQAFSDRETRPFVFTGLTWSF